MYCVKRRPTAGSVRRATDRTHRIPRRRVGVCCLSLRGVFDATRNKEQPGAVEGLEVGGFEASGRNGPGTGVGPDGREEGPGVGGEEEGPGVGHRKDREEGPGVSKEEGLEVDNEVSQGVGIGGD